MVNTARDPLLDITNVVHVQPHSSNRSQAKASRIATRPKLLRQTSLLAFTGARGSATSACSSEEDEEASSCSASACFTSPPPPPSSLFTTSSSSTLASTSACHAGAQEDEDEGYSSLASDDVDDGCDDDDDDDDSLARHSSNLDGKSRAVKRRRKRSAIEQHDEQAERDDDNVASSAVVEVVDQARLARRRKLYARNTLGAVGLPRLGLEDALRAREYSASSSLHAARFAATRGSYSNHHLRSFVSHDTYDVYRPISSRYNRDYTVPFACAFSNESKRGGRQILAVSDEEGTVTLLNADPRTEQDRRGGTPRSASSLTPHANAVFDVRWSNDDRHLATASGDQSVRLTDVESRKTIATFQGHTCSVKQVAFDPHNPNLLASTSRDGSIAVWDRRSSPAKGPTSVSPVNHIRFAHDTYARSRKGKESHRSSTRSVTSVVYLQHQDHLLASAGSADGVIKLWDLRKVVSRRINPPSIEASWDYTPTLSTTSPSSSEAQSGSPSSSYDLNNGYERMRAHGISSLCLSPDGSKLFALSTNSRICLYDPRYMSRNVPSMQTFSAPNFACTSFYVRLAISPDGRYLASGSGAHGYKTHIWDLNTFSARNMFGETNKASVALKGHTAEVGGLDWSSKSLATSGDDCLVRLWQSDEDAASARSQEGSDAKWHYSGACEQD